MDGFDLSGFWLQSAIKRTLTTRGRAMQLQRIVRSCTFPNKEGWQEMFQRGWPPTARTSRSMAAPNVGLAVMPE
jgi:hypothetical protein